MLTVDHIRYATGKQLCQIFGTSDQVVSSWTTGRSRPSGLLLERAQKRIGVSKSILMDGLDMRRKDFENMIKHQKELDQVLEPSVVEVA